MDNQIPIKISIPVIFYDGEQEITLENVEITPVMTFKLLQSTLSNKIGISPNHITIYLDRSNINGVNNINYHQRRRHPVTSKFDFTSLVVGECFFWVVLKRGRRNRRRRNNKTHDAPVDGPFVLLRRSNNDEIINWEYLEYVNKMRYLMSLNLNSNVYNGLINDNYDYNNINNNNNGSNYNYSDDFGSGSSSSERVFCDVCYNSNGGEIPFHWCKNDVIVSTGFKSIVGPIAPPSKN